MKTARVGICGHFGANKKFLDGQTVKTKILTETLKINLGSKFVMDIDTYGWKQNPVGLFFKCFFLLKNCRNIIILPAQNGVKVFVPLFLLINKIFHRKLHYVVIGGWLPELLETKPKLKNQLKKFDGIYVETYSMVKALENLELNNAIYLPNFKRLNILKENELVYSTGEPYKLCTFSRVMKEKGIEDAIEAVKGVNRFYGRNVYTLDIYGQVDEKYRDKFEELKKNFPKYITYKGVVKFSDSVKVLKDYFALLFPTYYEGEGFAGTILDAYASGVPVIATNWRYNSEIIQDKIDGIIFENKNISELQRVLKKIKDNPKTINEMKQNCLKRAEQYSPDVVIEELITYF